MRRGRGEENGEERKERRRKRVEREDWKEQRKKERERGKEEQCVFRVTVEDPSSVSLRASGTRCGLDVRRETELNYHMVK